MKNFTCLIFSFLFLFHAFMGKSQGNYDYNYYNAFEVYLIEHGWVELNPNGKFREAIIVSDNGKKKSTIIKRFNEKGQMTECYKGKNSDSIAKKAIFKYDDKFQLQKVNIYKKHKLDHQYLYEFNEKGKIIQLNENDSDGDVITNKSWKYNSDGYVEEASVSKWKSPEIKFLWKYEYYDSSKLSRIAKYKKGKLKEEWDYMCNEAGEKVTKKNFNNVCRWHETSKDTLTAIYQSTDHKGRTTKTIYKYTTKDTLILSYAQYNHKNEIIRKNTYDQSYERLLTWSYYKNGKMGFELSHTYTNGKLVSSIGHYPTKNKIRFRDEYLYDDSNNLLQQKRFNKKNKITSEINITYTKR